jgi:orotate phosphoribosyltransferase
MIVSPYLYDCLDPIRLKRIISQAVADLTPFTEYFDGIAFKGVSGAMVAPSVAMVMEKKLVLVRDDIRTHSWSLIEGDKTINNYIIIDDIVETGATVRYIIKQMKTFNRSAQIVGRYLYNPVNTQLQIWNADTEELIYNSKS